MISENTKERIKEVEAKALETLDYLVETITGLDFIEVVGGIGRTGGSMITYRVYEDGSVRAS